MLEINQPKQMRVVGFTTETCQTFRLQDPDTGDEYACVFKNPSDFRYLYDKVNQLITVEFLEFNSLPQPNIVKFLEN